MKWLIVVMAVTGLIMNSFCCGKKETPVPAEQGAIQQQAAEQPGQVKAAQDTTIAEVYPLDYCIVSEQKLGTMGEPVVYQHEGKTIKFCCPACVETFKKDPAKYLEKIEAAVKAKAEK